VKITHLSAYDLSGGAARAAYRLHTGLRSLGHESRLLALYKTSSDPNVVGFDPPQDIATRLRRGLKRRLLERDGSEVTARPAGSTFFTDDRSQHSADALRQFPATDVLNLHWIAGFIDYRAFFQKLPRGFPVVWTLHDMNPFTGGCHYDEGCGKFRQKCGACPQLDSSDSGDFSSRVWRRKRAAFSSRGAQHLHVVTPSRWLADEARKSSLFYQYAPSVIPYGIDTEHFQPRDRSLAREKYGIPSEAKTILFVADSASERRKGLGVLLEALRGLEDSEEYFFVVMGRGVTDLGVNRRFKMIDHLDDETTLSFVYSAADVFVIPSLQDNLPNTAIEALACGTPAIGSNVGGIPEVIRDHRTGRLVPSNDPPALKRAIVTLLGEPEYRASMAKESRRLALQEHSLDIQARRYQSLYEELIKTSGLPLSRSRA
jgi:glycosyltransferase involved in cell wall biosynthesis